MEGKEGRTVRINLLGGLRVQWNDRTSERFPYKVGALLAYLAYFPHRLHPRETLLELFWPEREPEAARHNLRQTLLMLRRELEAAGVSADDLLLTDRTHIRLRPDTFTVDTVDLRAAVREAERAANPAERAEPLARILALYQGELLPGYYDDWIETERTEWIETYGWALRQAAQDAEETGNLSQALSFARRLQQIDPLDESASCRLMRLFAAAGRASQAQRHYRELTERLKEELDAEPSLETDALAQQLTPKTLLSIPLKLPDMPAIRPTPGGALPPDSPLYVVRQTDGEFLSALARRESIVLIKGARQVGKTSLMARGLQLAREQGTRVVLTDFQRFNTESLTSLQAFYVALADSLAGRLGLQTSLQETWEARRSPNANFETYLVEEALPQVSAPLVWALDEVDRLFVCDFGSEVFGLFRSWHNERALDPGGPWSELTLAMAYATEAHLFITDLNQSPFNVGTRLELHDFSFEQVMELNRAYGSPLRKEPEQTRFYDLIGGQPYLTQRGLYTLVTQSMDMETFAAEAVLDEGLLGDHLHRILILLRKNPPLMETLRQILNGRPCADAESFYRLRSAGILTGATQKQCRLRCALYASYLKRQLSA